MDLQTLLSYEWGIMAPEFIILGTATLLSLIDLFMGQGKDRKPLAYLGIAGVIIALFYTIGLLDHEPAQILHGTYRLDSFSSAFKLLLLTGAGLVLLMSTTYKPKDEIVHRGEFYYLFLTALLGAMFMASSVDLITLFVGLELLSISSYVLAGMRKTNKQSNEAAMKYVVNGGISTAITLFGLSYIYGLSGSTNLFDISQQFAQLVTGDLQLLISIAFLMVFVGLAFKIASVPFHMWSPDVYQGSPTPVTAFLSVVSKTAGFVLILRFFILTFFMTPAIGNEEPLLIYMQDFIAVLAGITMVVGNAVALRQTNIKRLFAYSSIAHAGYLLVPFVAFSALMFEGVWFYLVAYLLMNLGAFAILQTVIDQNNSEEISGFRGLYNRSPILAISLSIFLLSLAGIPGTAGFVGKLNIFLGALGTDPAHYVLAGVMMATTVISYFYYFGIMKEMFFHQSEEKTIQVPAGIAIVVGICLVGTIAFGIMPNLAFEFFYNNFDFMNFFGQ